MDPSYNEDIAFHYSAYRPHFHLGILKECLEGDSSYSLGLDVGCGTGQSSIALSHFCDQVIGIEPSHAMLKETVDYPNVSYAHFDKKRIAFPDNYFDIVTFAGSLFYAKSQQVLDEVVRASHHSSVILIYDFQLLLDPVLENLGIELREEHTSNYNFTEDFEGLNLLNIEEGKSWRLRLDEETAVSNIAHLILSSRTRYSHLARFYSRDDLYGLVNQKLQGYFNSNNARVEGLGYAKVYINKKGALQKGE